MTSMDYQFPCECGEDVLIEVVITSYGHPGTSPSLYYPGDPPEGAEYHLKQSETCEKCGKVWDDDEVWEKLDDKIQERIAEPPDLPEPDYGY